MNVDPSGNSVTAWWEWAIAGVVVAGLIIGSIFTGGLVAAAFTGTAIGALIGSVSVGAVGAGIYALEAYWYNKEFSKKDMFLSGTALALKCMLNCTLGFFMGSSGMYSKEPNFSIKHPFKSINNIIKYKNIEIVDRFIAKTPLTYVYNLFVDSFFETAKGE